MRKETDISPDEIFLVAPGFDRLNIQLNSLQYSQLKVFVFAA